MAEASTAASKTSRLGLWVLPFAAMIAACSKDPEPKKPRPPSAAVPKAVAVPIEQREENVTYRFDAPERLVAIGDVHGDLDATRKALRLAGAIDGDDKWIGGKLVVVQTGDELDRGDDEREIVELFDSLADQAKRVGGAVHALNGNHETMNVAGDFRYVTSGGFEDFVSFAAASPDRRYEAFPPFARGRAAAFLPGGPFARRLAERRVIVVVGDSVFAHGGVTTNHVKFGIERINRETARWMHGESATPPALIVDNDGPVWTRRYSDLGTDADCAELGRTLGALHLKRMVVGHTPQKSGITSACNDRIWRIDVGLARYYGGPVEVLQLRGDRVTVLRGRGGASVAEKAPAASPRPSLAAE